MNRRLLVAADARGVILRAEAELTLPIQLTAEEARDLAKALELAAISCAMEQEIEIGVGTYGN